ncbi:hypothetical protein ACEWY4_016224 [Coilia grayii]|uniref:Uncharacterized protein n=1 Tax=Coilia grayii TaxID=363190 RepID=A0ABD1JMG5_9TELE
MESCCLFLSSYWSPVCIGACRVVDLEAGGVGLSLERAHVSSVQLSTLLHIEGGHTRHGRRLLEDCEAKTRAEMTSFVWIVVLAGLVATQAQDLDLFDALDDGPPTEKPKVPEAPKNPDGFDLADALGPDPEPDKPAVVPPKDGGTGGTGGFDLNDAFGDPEHTPTNPKKPAGDGFDLGDALGPDPEPDKPAVVPPKDGGTGGTGGGSFSLDDLGDVAGGNDYKPDGGRGGARAADPAYDGPANDQPADAVVPLPWARVLAQLLGDDLPEGLHQWIANLQATLKPLLQGALDLIDIAMGNQEEA